EKVLKRYRRGTTEVRGSYRIPTAGLHAFCTSAVSRPVREYERMVRFSLRRLFFKEPNDILTPAALSLICFSLKSLFFKATKNKVVFSYVLLWFSSILSSLIVLKNIRIHSVGFLCFMLFSLPMDWAQSAETRAAERQTTVNALTVGEKVPTDFWPQEHLFYVDGDTVRATLEEYKGKVLLLDFWATWCGTCIASMPRIHALQDSFAQDMAVLPVTQQSAVIVSKFIAGNSDLSQIDLHSIVGDSVLKKIFPHKMIPHVVWIVDEKVYAISNSVDVTKVNILNALNSAPSQIPVKIDVMDYNSGLPLLLANNGAREDYFLSRSIITDKIEGIPSTLNFLKANERDDSFIISATNASPRNLYSLAFKKLRTIPMNRIIFDSRLDRSDLEHKFFKELY